MATAPRAGPQFTIDADEVRRIAVLARLRIDADTIPAYVQHFRRMLGFVAELEEADVTGVEPDLHPHRSAESLRADRLREAGAAGGPLPRDAVLANAPQSEGPYFATPRVV